MLCPRTDAGYVALCHLSMLLPKQVPGSCWQQIQQEEGIVQAGSWKAGV